MEKNLKRTESIWLSSVKDLTMQKDNIQKPLKLRLWSLREWKRKNEKRKIEINH